MPYPIVIFRYFIIKEPMAKRTAKEFTSVYGFIASLISFAVGFAFNNYLILAVILIWSFVNYFVLVSGKAKVSPESNDINTQTTISSDIAKNTIENTTYNRQSQIDQEKADNPDQSLYCTACGTKLDPDSIYCDKCGRKVN